MNVNTELNRELLAEIAAESISKVANSKDARRWVNAIAKAVVEIENNPFMHFDFEEKHLVL